jgi:hypothetical protein
MTYNPELDKLLCDLDGKITAYRMKHIKNGLDLSSDNLELFVIQNRIQLLWDANISEKVKNFEKIIKNQDKLNGASC